MTGLGVRVRFAPSPTGYLHVGSARTALFNWLFARHCGGKVVLRVEDTDETRYKNEWLQAIFEGLRWLGLDWDEGPDVGGPYAPYRQRERISLHAETAWALLDKNAAYECFCGPEAASSAGRASSPPTAVCCCRDLSPDERAARRKKIAVPAVRMRVDKAAPIVVEDIVRGSVTFPAGSLEDFVIVKSGGGPLYNFAAAVDDRAMAISHVIRGEEHLANTPKQLLVYQAMGWRPPLFAHLPIILNEQRAKLSKRDGAAFLADYEAMGILPAAMLNFLALLGWSPGDDREILTREELIAQFDLDRVVKHPAIFDAGKLRWMNGEYMKTAPMDELEAGVRRLIERSEVAAGDVLDGNVVPATELLRGRVRTLADIVDQGGYLLRDGPVTPTPEALATHCAAPDTADRLRRVRAALHDLPEFAASDVETAIRSLAQRDGSKAAAYIHPLRVALTGQAVSPGIFEVAQLVGKQLSLQRIDGLIGRIERRRAPDVGVLP